MDDWSNQFNSLMNSPLGKELVRSLSEDLHNSLVAEAESSESGEKAFGLLKEASGVTKALAHLRMRAVVSEQVVPGSEEGVN